MTQHREIYDSHKCDLTVKNIWTYKEYNLNIYKVIVTSISYLLSDTKIFSGKIPLHSIPFVYI